MVNGCNIRAFAVSKCIFTWKLIWKPKTMRFRESQAEAAGGKEALPTREEIKTFSNKNVTSCTIICTFNFYHSF